MKKEIFDKQSPNLLVYDKVDSTSNEAKRIIERGDADFGMIILALEQTDARGRYGRKWYSPRGNLYFSFILDREEIKNSLNKLPFIIALAIREAIIEEADLDEIDLQFKWPNDILLNGKKVAGILLESQLMGSDSQYIICGIGINIEKSPIGMSHNVTAFHEENIESLVKDKLFYNVLLKFEEKYNQYFIENDEALYDNWLKFAAKIDEEIIVRSGEKEIRGIFKTIRDGALIVSDGNEEHSIVTGDIFFSEKEFIITGLSSINLNNVTFLKRRNK